MDFENPSLFDDTDLFYTQDESKNDFTAESTQDKSVSSTPADPLRNIEEWFMEKLKKLIPEDIHSMYINENNILFAFGPLELEEFDLKQQTECIYEITNRGKRSVLSCFDTITYYTNLTYRNETQRKRISLDHKTDPAFLRVIEPRTGKFILSNLIKCASQQQKGLRNYLDYVKKNIFSFPLLEELNRFALSQKLAYRSARQKLWFLMSIAEELKLVEGGKTYKRFTDKTEEINRKLLDKKVTLRYFKTSKKTTSQEVSQITLPSEQTTPSGSRISQLQVTQDNLSSTEKVFSRDLLGESNLNDSQMEPSSNVSMIAGSNNNPFETNSSLLPDPSQSYSVDVMSMNSSVDLGTPFSSGTQNPIGFTSLHIGEMSTPVRKDPDYQNKQVDSFDSNFMKLIDLESTSLFEFDNLMETSKSTQNYSESSQTGWQALQMIKKNKTKVEEPKMKHFVQKGLDKFVQKKQSFAFKNAVSTISVLEAACKLYGKGPKWSNPNKKEFEIANKTKKLVYVKPSKTIKKNDLTYHYLMQYASVHQKLNGGIRQEHAVMYGIIDLIKTSPNEPVKSYKVNTEPWNDDKFSKKWAKLANAINFSPWIIAKFNDPKHPKNLLKHFPLPNIYDSQSVSLEKDSDKEFVLEKHRYPKFITTNENEDSQTDISQKQEQKEGNIEGEKQTEDVEMENLDKKMVDYEEDGSNKVEPESAKVEMEPESSEKESTIATELGLSQILEPKTEEQEYIESQLVEVSVTEQEECENIEMKVKTEPAELTRELSHTSTTDGDNPDQMFVETQVQGENITNEYEMEKEETPKASVQTEVQPVEVSQEEKTKDLESESQEIKNKTTGPEGKQMKLTELFKYVYGKISKAKQLPEFPELMLTNKNKETVKKELENYTKIDKETIFQTKRRKVLDDEYPEPMPENYVKINKVKSITEVKEPVLDSDDENYNEYMNLDENNENEKEETKKEYQEEEEEVKENKTESTLKKVKLSKKEKIMKMREIMKSMIEFEAEESEDENLSDPEDIKRSLELLKQKLMNPSESESEIESETEIAKEMKDFIGEVEINEEDEEIARQRFYEDLRIQEEAELAKLMTFKEKGEKELTRREERLKMLMKLKNAKKTDEFHLSDFESSDEESGEVKKHRVKVTREDIDRLLKFKQNQKNMSKEEQLEQFIDFKLTEANIKLPSIEEVTVSTNFIEVPKSEQEHESVTKIKNRRDMVDNMFNEGFDSIFSNIDQYRSDSSLTVNPFGTPNRTLDKLDNSSSKSPKKPALRMKSFRWDHSQAKPGNMTTVRNFRGFTGFHNFPSTFGQGKTNNK